MQTLFTLSYVALAVVHLVTYAAIVGRHAVPKAPKAFHYALTVPMLGGVVLLFLLAVLVTAETDSLLGLSITTYRTLFIYTDVAWLSVLLYYSYYHYTHGRNEGGA